MRERGREGEEGRERGREGGGGGEGDITGKRERGWEGERGREGERKGGGGRGGGGGEEVREMEGGIFCGLFPRLSEFVRVALVGSYDSLRETTRLILDMVLCARSSF